MILMAPPQATSSGFNTPCHPQKGRPVRQPMSFLGHAGQPAGKTMITVFFTTKILIVFSALPRGSTLNQRYFINNTFPDLERANLNCQRQKTEIRGLLIDPAKLQIPVCHKLSQKRNPETAPPNLIPTIQTMSLLTSQQREKILSILFVSRCLCSSLKTKIHAPPRPSRNSLRISLTRLAVSYDIPFFRAKESGLRNSIKTSDGSFQNHMSHAFFLEQVDVPPEQKARSHHGPPHSTRRGSQPGFDAIAPSFYRRR
jgi:hypothetical protein